MALLLVSVMFAQGIESKLSQEALFTPGRGAVLDQLIAIAKNYHIPMGIEMHDSYNARMSVQIAKEPRSVHDLINKVLEGVPHYSVNEENGVLHVADPILCSDSRNFLNLRIREFRLKDASVYDADARLRMMIRMTLHPELYAQGWNGGHGHPPGGPFDAHNITFSGSDLTVRDILDKIVASNGNAMWIVHLNPEQMMAEEPFFVQGQSPDSFQWKLIPLVEVKDQK